MLYVPMIYELDQIDNVMFLSEFVSCPMRRARLLTGNMFPAVRNALMLEHIQASTGEKIPTCPLSETQFSVDLTNCDEDAGLHFHGDEIYDRISLGGTDYGVGEDEEEDNKDFN
jgi:hypothetical protein